MRHRRIRRALIVRGQTLVVLALCWMPSLAENIDPAGANARFAWSENTGWFNAQPLGPGGPGLQIDDFEVTGWLYGENTGWVSLSCKNTSSCERVQYGVLNDGAGNLSGKAWAENLGWIDFHPVLGGASLAGVSIDPATGEFGGTAWMENAGWLSFGLGATGLAPIRTAWTCDPRAPAPSLAPSLDLEPAGADALVRLAGAGDAAGHDVVLGDLGTLLGSGGDFGAATSACLANDFPFESILHSGSPRPGDGIWFLARGVTCSGIGTYDAPAVPGASSQVGTRDAEIDSSPSPCP